MRCIFKLDLRNQNSKSFSNPTFSTLFIRQQPVDIMGRCGFVSRKLIWVSGLTKKKMFEFDLGGIALPPTILTGERDS